MPCTDGGVPFPPSRQERLAAKMPAALCAVFHVLEEGGDLLSVLEEIDEQEAGVTKEEILEWYTRHKEEDAERHRQERVRKAEKAERIAALAKLSAKDKKVLGLD